MSPISMPVFAAAGASGADASVVGLVSVMRFRSSRRLYCSARPGEAHAQPRGVVQLQSCDCLLLGGKKVFNAKYAKDSRRAHGKAPDEHQLHHYPAERKLLKNSPRRATRGSLQSAFLTATKDAVYGLDSSPRMSPIYVKIHTALVTAK